MKISAKIKAQHSHLRVWRQDIHAHPETAFEEHRTADFVAAKLKEFNIEVHRGLGKTGVVGTLQRGQGKKSIALRADMDALFIQEENDFEYCSKNKGKMHACGHDGHTTMLLGAAEYLAKHGKFNGTIRFIFQPAEETGDEKCGANTMVKEGLFTKFPVDCIFGMHNYPGLPEGHFSVRSGAMLASIDTFEFKVVSKLGHPAAQHSFPDPILVASKLVDAFHCFKARGINPAEPVILSITQFQAGDPFNDRQGVHVAPKEAWVRGTIYTHNDEVRDIIEIALSKIVIGMAGATGAKCIFKYERGYPVLLNSEKEKELAVSAASSVVGENSVETNMQPMMGAEDFAFMLKKCPGCYVFIGNGTGSKNGMPCLDYDPLHNSHYDFNDNVIPIGVQYWTNLAEEFLSKGD